MDRDFPEIVARWEAAVLPIVLSCKGFPPTCWRTALCDAVCRPGFGTTLLRNVKHRLHGQFRSDLRRQISEATRQRSPFENRRNLSG